MTASRVLYPDDVNFLLLFLFLFLLLLHPWIGKGQPARRKGAATAGLASLLITPTHHALRNLSRRSSERRRITHHTRNLLVEVIAPFTPQYNHDAVSRCCRSVRPDLSRATDGAGRHRCVRRQLQRFERAVSEFGSPGHARDQGPCSSASSGSRKGGKLMASLIQPNCGFVLYETRAARLTKEFSRKRSVRLPASPGSEKPPSKPGTFRIPVDFAPTPVEFRLEPAYAQAV